MLSHVEQDILNEFIGSEGIYFQSIMENTFFSTAYKIVYLQRSITLGCDAFLSAIDKLYEPEHEENFSFIINLKHINDLCFNNMIINGEYGEKSTLEHYFSQISKTIYPPLFQDFIIARISANIQAVKDSCNTTQLNEDIAQLIFNEAVFCIPKTQWRRKAELPLMQLKPKKIEATCPQQVIADISAEKYIQVLDPIIQNLLYFKLLSPEEFICLNPVQFKMLSNAYINQILSSSGIGINDRLSVRTTQQMNNVIAVYSLKTSLGEFNFSAVLRLTHLQLSMVDKLAELSECGIIENPMDILPLLNLNQTQNLNTIAIIFLMHGKVLTFDEAINISPEQRQKIMHHQSSEVVREIKYPTAFSGCCNIS